MKICKIVLYDEPTVPEINIEKTKKFLVETFGIQIEIRENIFKNLDKKICEKIASCRITKLKKSFEKHSISKEEQKSILKMVSKEKTLSKKIERLETMKKYFRYWHVAHMPFAIIMLVIVVVNVIVAFTFGYKWIF